MKVHGMLGTVSGLLLSGAMVFAVNAFAQQDQSNNQQMQQEKQDIKNAASQAKGQYGTMQSTLQEMKGDEGKVSDQATKDYMQKNDQMWQQALQQEKEVGRAAKQARQHHKQKQQQSSSSNPQ